MSASNVEIIVGDCRETLRALPDASVQCVVTSPPYFGLRDYGHGDQIGLEPTPDEFVAALVAVFRQVRRVLRDDGTVWLNLGDNYRDKQRCLMPARVALAAQSDGWWVRDEVVWHKPRTTPWPATDRTVPAHEMVYLLTKSATYFFDYKAIEEPAIYAGAVRSAGKAFRDLAEQDPKAARKRPSADRVIEVAETRRKRSVWSVSPEPYGLGHFATMPTKIVETCILAGSRRGDTVLDPFGGAGTTGLVAARHGRRAVLCELNPEYARLARERIDREWGEHKPEPTDDLGPLFQGAAE